MTYDNEYGTCTLPAGVCFSTLRAAQFFTSYFSRNVRNVRGLMTVNGQRATGGRTRDEEDGRPPSLDMRTALPAAPRLVADAGRHSGVLARP